MTLDDLNKTEKLALVGLTRLLIRADKEFSSEEAASLERIGKELGEEPFWALIREVATFEDEQIREHAKNVERRDVQELIYGALYEIAVAGTIAEEESDFLDWLSDTWNLAARIDPTPDEIADPD